MRRRSVWRTVQRRAQVTEIVLGLFSTGMIGNGAWENDLNEFLLGIVCLAALLFIVLNERWGCK